MKARLTWAAAGMVVMLLVSTFHFATAQANDSSPDCQALKFENFDDIQDAPTQVDKANVVEATGDMPAHCLVEGYVAPQIGFQLRLPTSKWNGKFVEIGCGGFCGMSDDAYQHYIAYCADALRRGYACILHDGGHKGGPALWAYNNLQAEIDYGFRSAHVVAIAGKAITEHYYKAAPQRSYFMGCSGGGRQALIEAQDFPWDFDGIIAMDPSSSMPSQVTMLWNNLVTRDQSGQPLFTPADIDVLHNAVLAKCDLDDGVKDGVIGYPPACRFDPSELTCKDGRKSGCLSPAQVTAARKVYSGPVTSQGERLPFHYPSLPGAEKGGFFVAQGHGPHHRYYLRETLYRYLLFMPDPGPSWNVEDFDFDRDYKRLSLAGRIRAAANPDLRQFKARGGKLIIVQGWDDSGSPLPLSTVDYYETVERTMGGPEPTQEFARLFMIPGRAHCSGGPGVNSVDFLSHLEAWVEGGRAPDMMIGAGVEGARISDSLQLPEDPAMINFTRPLYPYPRRYQYKGSGDPNDYRNFKPVDP